MKKLVFWSVTPLILASCLFCASCDGEKKDPASRAAQQVGRQYGQTLHGAITQSHDLQQKLSERFQPHNPATQRPTGMNNR